MAYYVLIFDVAWEVILKKFNMGEDSAKTSGMSTMVVETNTTYDNEIKEGDEVEILLTFFDHDKKRLHFRLEMIEKKTKKLSSTIEMLSLHVDLNKRKVAEFNEERTKLMNTFISENQAKFKSDNLKFTGKLKK
jgi:acyl-CoA thioester hydrolase